MKSEQKILARRTRNFGSAIARCATIICPERDSWVIQDVSPLVLELVAAAAEAEEE